MIVKYKVSDFAKDLNLSAKKVLDELAAMGSTGKKNSSNLEENELNYLLEKFSKDSSVTDLNEFLNSAKAPKEEPKPAEKKAEKKTEKKPEAPKAEEKPAQKPAEKKPEQKAQPAAQQNQQAKAGSKHGDKKNEQHKKREEKTVSLSELARETGAKASTAPAQAVSVRREDNQVTVDTRTVDMNVDRFDARYDDLASTKNTENRRKPTPQGNKQKFTQRGQRQRQQFQKGKRETEFERLQRIQLEKARNAQLKVLIPDEITVGELAARLKQQAGKVIAKFMQMGEMHAINDVIDFDTASLVAEELGAKVEHEVIVTIEDRLIDEDAVRTSPIHFGLVMTELGSLRSVQCPIEDIPEGQLKDYMLASSACFPALRPREIDGVKYIDGGWRDNMPLDLAARMGATELLGVDVDGIGIVRPNTTGLPTRIVRSHWDLGPTLDFDPARAGRNIALGYFDTLRLFGRCGGTAYAMLPDNEEFLARFAEQYQKLLAEVCARAPEIDLVEKNARLRANYPAPYAPNPSAPTRGALAPLELAAEHVGVPEDMPYTPKLLAATFMGSFDKDPADRFPALLDGRDNTLVTERAIAAAVPEEFVTALVSKTLGKLPIL